jgi:hypothetical protein
MQKILKFRWLSMVIGIVLVLAIAGVSYAVNYTLNQNVGISIIVNPTTNPPPETPITTYVYSDTGLSNVITQMDFQYNQGGSDTYTGFVPAEVTSVNLESISGLTGFTFDVALGNAAGSYREVTITASGGEGRTEPYSGFGTFTGS